MAFIVGPAQAQYAPPELGVKLEVVAPDYELPIGSTTLQTVRAHVLAGLPAMLRRHFGFLRWSAGGGRPPWTLTVSIQQLDGCCPKPGIDVRLQLTLVNDSGTTIRSLARPPVFEKWIQLDGSSAYLRPVVDTIVPRWLAKIDAALTFAHDTVVATLLGEVPVNVHLSLVQSRPVATLGIRDRDIAVDEDHRGLLAMKGVAMVTFRPQGEPPSVARGTFLLGQCRLTVAADPIYLCDMIELEHASVVYRRDSLRNYLNQCEMTRDPRVYFRHYESASGTTVDKPLLPPNGI